MKLHKLLDWRLVLLFGVAGPPIGIAFISGIVIVVYQDASGFIRSLPVLIAMAYVVGGLPAVLTGLIFPAAYSFTPIRRPYPLPTYLFVAAVTGGMVSFFCGKVVFSESPGTTFTITLAGAFSAPICAVIAANMGIGPDNALQWTRKQNPRAS